MSNNRYSHELSLASMLKIRYYRESSLAYFGKFAKFGEFGKFGKHGELCECRLGCFIHIKYVFVHKIEYLIILARV
jgi:hypothetical protein